mmetsp:Transcript_165533/g.317739  ORF Transcript_165533/g.317739 Transcript_165533/m.317739 type:complete len:201 (-) Transcript_165533:188-790(-)
MHQRFHTCRKLVLCQAQVATTRCNVRNNPKHECSPPVHRKPSESFKKPRQCLEQFFCRLPQERLCAAVCPYAIEVILHRPQQDETRQHQNKSDTNMAKEMSPASCGSCQQIAATNASNHNDGKNEERGQMQQPRTTSGNQQALPWPTESVDEGSDARLDEDLCSLRRAFPSSFGHPEGGKIRSPSHKVKSKSNNLPEEAR